MKSAFTLIEALVVTTIIIIMSGAVLISQRQAGPGLALQRSAFQLSQDLKKAKDLAMNTKEFEGDIPDGGYGVYIQSSGLSSYKIYADLNGNQRFDNPSSDGVVEERELEQDIIINSISSSPLSVNFLAPDPEVTISGDFPATIELALESDPSRTKTIKINRLGLISIE